MKKAIQVFINKTKSRDSIVSRSFSALFFSFLGAGCSKLCIMAMNVILSRLLGVEVYGQYSTVYSTIQTFVTFSSGGVGASMVRYTAMYRKKDKRACGQIISTLFFVCLILCIVLVSTLYVFSNPISNLVSGEGGLSLYLRISAVVILLVAVSSILQNVLVGFEKFKSSTFIDIICGIASILFVTGFTYFMGIVGALIGLILARLFTGILFLITTMRVMREESIPITVRFNEIVKEPIFKFTIPSFIAAISVVPITFVANAMLVRNAGYVDMAIYNVAAQWVAIIAYITILFTKVKPIYIDLLDKEDIKGFASLVKKMVLLSTLCGSLISFVLICLARPILSIYGDGYQGGRIVYIIMISSAILISTQSQFGAVLEALGKMRIGMVLNLIWGFNLLSIFYLLIDKGALGYSIAYFGSYALHCLYSWLIVFYEFKKLKSVKKRYKF